jgi:helix-turn-helix protein
MLFQLRDAKGELGLVSVTKNHTEVSEDRFSEIIEKSLENFKKLSYEEEQILGIDTSDFSDFILYHNERSVLEIERVFTEEIYVDYL